MPHPGFINELGHRYGSWVVLARCPNSKDHQANWHCKCDCGKESIVTGNSLRTGSSTSCGCRHGKTTVGYLPAGEAAFRKALRRMKDTAKRREFIWKLSDVEAKTLMDSSCSYCGKPPSNVCNPKDCNGSYTYSGIDRVDNLLGYIITNVVSCCIECNKAKGSRSVTDFMNGIDRLVVFNKKETSLTG